VSYAIQRKNMVESQVRPSDVTDRRILRAMLEVPREAFVAEPLEALAYADGPVAMSKNGGARPRMLLPARTFAKMVQAAGLGPDAAVLDVGAGTGYSSAILARLARQVVALDCDPALAKQAEALLAGTGTGTVKVVTGDLAQGWAQEGPYDAIVLEGDVEVTPDRLLDQLKDGGRLVAIVGGGPTRTGSVKVWHRDGATFGAIAIFDAVADVLPGFEAARVFAL